MKVKELPIVPLCRNQIDFLDEYFRNAELKVVQLNHYGIVTSPDIFIDGHLRMCRQAPDTRIGRIYFERLLAYKRMLPDGMVPLPAPIKDELKSIIHDSVNDTVSDSVKIESITKPQQNTTPTLF